MCRSLVGFRPYYLLRHRFQWYSALLKPVSGPYRLTRELSVLTEQLQKRKDKSPDILVHKLSPGSLCWAGDWGTGGPHLLRCWRLSAPAGTHHITVHLVIAPTTNIWHLCRSCEAPPRLSRVASRQSTLFPLGCLVAGVAESPGRLPDPSPVRQSPPHSHRGALVFLGNCVNLGMHRLRRWASPAAAGTP